MKKIITETTYPLTGPVGLLAYIEEMQALHPAGNRAIKQHKELLLKAYRDYNKIVGFKAFATTIHAPDFAPAYLPAPTPVSFHQSQLF